MRIPGSCPAAASMLAAFFASATAWSGDAPDRFVHGDFPGDKGQTATPAPPTEPFEAAGFAVQEASWDSRPVRVSRFACPWAGAHNPWVRAYRERYGFVKHMEKGTTEVEKLLLLRQWVNQQIKRGREDSMEQDPFVILDSAAEGKGYICTQYSVTMQAVAVASGWPAWNMEIDWDHSSQEPSHAHSVTEVWINDLGKWVVFDAMYNAHYEKNGVMLNAAELSREWVADQGAHVDVLRGVERQKVAGVRTRVLRGKNDAAGYFWSKHIWSWDPFRSFGTVEPDMQVAFITDAHEGKQWYQGRPPNTYLLHAIQRGALHLTRREADVNPDIGLCSLDIRQDAAPGAVRVKVATFTPGFEALLVSFDGGPPVSAVFNGGPPAAALTGTPEKPFAVAWALHEGTNTLSVRTRNEFGTLGKPTQVRVVLRKK